jgi:hypothetical protein
LGKVIYVAVKEVNITQYPELTSKIIEGGGEQDHLFPFGKNPRGGLNAGGLTNKERGNSALDVKRECRS